MGQDPFRLGIYCYPFLFAFAPYSYYVEHHDNLRSPVDNVYFAGEATSYKYYGCVGLKDRSCLIGSAEADVPLGICMEHTRRGRAPGRPWLKI